MQKNTNNNMSKSGNAKAEFPMRINRYLALRGYCTRREADVWIEKGRVLINGNPARLGDRVEKSDKVELISKSKKIEKKVYFAYYKPKGEEVKERYNRNLFPVGRLDKESEGLLILTNDGRITDRLLNPDREHEKEYEVEVDKPITNHFLKIMARGVDIEGYKTKPAQLEQFDDKTFSIILTEGKKHQIRRMCAALGYQVQSLKRVRVMNIELDGLKSGSQREIEGEELKIFLKSLGL